MISINIGNIVTISVISVAAYAGLKFGLKLAGISPSWL
jgi:hypothetical protein